MGDESCGPRMKGLALFILLEVIAGVTACWTKTSHPTCQCGKYKPRSNRIIGGKNAAEHEFPWMVYIDIGGKFCGGTLLSDDTVLTAAHCLEDSHTHDGAYKTATHGTTCPNPRWTRGYTIDNPDIGASVDIPQCWHQTTSNYKVVVGEHNTKKPDQGESTILARLVVKHHKYDRFLTDYDYGIIKLLTPVTFTDTLYPICLPHGDQEDLGISVAAGWGMTDPQNSNSNSDVLQRVTLRSMDYIQCAQEIDQERVSLHSLTVLLGGIVGPGPLGCFAQRKTTR